MKSIHTAYKNAPADLLQKHQEASRQLGATQQALKQDLMTAR